MLVRQVRLIDISAIVTVPFWPNLAVHCTAAADPLQTYSVLEAKAKSKLTACLWANDPKGAQVVVSEGYDPKGCYGNPDV